jgi:hypothetical protein
MIAREADAEVRYLVAEVVHIWHDGRSATLQGAREYRTLSAAQARRDALVAEGKTVVLQTGIIEWLNDDAAHVRLRELARKGATFR